MALHGLDHKDMALGIKGGGLITLHSGPGRQVFGEFRALWLARAQPPSPPHIPASDPAVYSSVGHWSSELSFPFV